MNLSKAYNREDFLKFLDAFLPDFQKDIRVVNIQKLDSVQKAYSLGRSEKLNLQIFELSHKGSGNKRMSLTRDGFKIMSQTATYNSLSVFHSEENNDWRLSLMTTTPEVNDKGKIKMEFSNPRRYSFFLGPDARIHTPTQFLINKGRILDFSDLLLRFNVEIVTKEFFQQYRKLFEKLVSYLDKDRSFKIFTDQNNVDTNNFAKKLLGQIVFLYFLQRKGWLGAKKGDSIANGDKSFLRNLFNKSREEKLDFFNYYLEPLFYDALNKRTEKAGSFYRDYFNCQIPFLNGGLFEPIENYDWQNQHLDIPSSLFSSNPDNPENGEGILDIFDLYNFTVDESDDMDKEISVDPEMLGKVFENLIEENMRKGKGTYYTPREIVHYMCRESLVNYLVFKVPSVEDTTIRNLLNWNGSLVSFNNDDEQKIIEALKIVKIVDPACGSGAFLVGMLQEIVKAKLLINSFRKIHISEYDVKKETIQTSIYGVDIDAGAIEIAKLRLWLSLVVDYSLEEIEPLPNLDYKLMVGNSLIEKLDTLHKSSDGERNKMIDTLNFLKGKYFFESDSDEKKELREEINKLIRDLLNYENKKERDSAWDLVIKYRSQTKLFENFVQESFGKEEKKLTEKLKKLDKLKDIVETDHFEWHLNFNEVFEKGGFEIVIANPPYIDSESMVKSGQSSIREEIMKTYRMTKGNWDIYIAFFELGFKIMNEKGSLSFITPDKWISKPFGDELRKGTINNIFTIVKAGREIFESAKVDSIISFFSKLSSKELNIINFTNNKFTQLRTIDKQSLITPFTLDYLFSEHLDFLLKFNVIQNKLSDLGYCDSACATSDAYKLKPFIKNSLKSFNASTELKIINTGTIGKYFPRWGIHEMTYLGDKYLNPIVNKQEFLDSFKNSYSKKSIKPKLIIKGLNLLDVCLDMDGNIIPGKSTMIVTANNLGLLKFILSILNSKLPFYYIKERYPASSYNQGTTFTTDMINTLPIPKTTEMEQKPFIDLVDRILNITESEDYLQNLEKQSQVEKYEKEIDQIVYKLYDLTPEEKKIVENS